MRQFRKCFRPRGIESDGLKYYRERDTAGDYVSIDPATNDYYLRLGLDLLAMIRLRHLAVMITVSFFVAATIRIASQDSKTAD